MAFEDKFHIKFLRICGWNRFKFGTHTHTHTHTHTQTFGRYCN